MSGPTMEDVARLAGVGVATVDRVINQRAKVRPQTAQKVLAAAEQLGFHRTGLIRHRIEQQQAAPRLGILLQRQSTYFYRELGLALEQAAAGRAKLLIDYLDVLTPQHVAARLLSMARDVDAIAVVAADHPLISQAIDTLAARGMPVYALVSDLTADGCAGYVGLDNRKVGRTAAWAISRLSRQPGKVGLILGSHRYLCQEQCEISFRAYLREYAPQFQVLETLPSLEDINLAQGATLELLDRHPDLAGIYVAGGGIEGVIEALREEQRSGLVTICHDLTDITRQALNEELVSMVLSHPLEWMSTRLVDTMLAGLQGRNDRASVQVVLPFAIHTVANV
ncbi:LacI family DNA-binding transcriptional regulator [Vogesella sp. LIG4]|uniref:LacI family DNA-binding transcriptional regulator n=1 Tax=Vogesella sp. LIG4 TaxID=1192162 RepID=UPI00081FFACA|nr:LacI family DNA-binding transcriptional regulator [Vogesella sp. LIG4]SCK26172.1 LacI family transcriptional regulator [Vogesella sp. LIG4]